MKSVTVSSMKLLTAAFLIFGTLVPTAAGLPKAPWVQQRTKGHGRKLFGASIEKRGQKVRDDCVVKAALDIDAPKENIWAGLTEPEAVSIVEWMFAQPELNLTASEDAGSWDNTL